MLKALDRQADVCLVMPPVAFTMGPSLALGLLKGALNRAGITSCVDHADMYFNYALGNEYALQIDRGSMTDFLGEFVFARAAGITPAKGYDELRELMLRSSDIFDPLAVEERLRVVRLAEQTALEETRKSAERILAHDPKIVAVSSCFQQRNAALAICRKIKELRPQVKTMMGGANCFGRAGLAILRTFPFVDYVFFGESDDIFADVCRIAMCGSEEALPYGVLRNGDPLPEEAPHRIITDMDALPYPDYDDFMEILSTDVGRNGARLAGSAFDRTPGLALFVEASRGCWWGEKCPCTFCGLNGKIKQYRQKSAGRMLAEIRYFYERYGMRRIMFTDCVLPMDCVKELAPGLIGYGKDLELFAEVRSTLSDEDLRILSRAGFVSLQPGIESLSDHELHLMRKGVTAAQNISFLKSAARYGIAVSWNDLFGFPGETAEDYDQQTRLIPYLEHLTPPNSCSWLIYARDNEYESHREKYGLSLKPAALYDYVCPDDPSYKEDIAIYFERANTETESAVRQAGGNLQRACLNWLKQYYENACRPRLDMADQPDGSLLVIDTRSCRDLRAQLLIGTEAELLRACRRPVQGPALAAELRKTCSEEQMNRAAKTLMAKKLLMRSGRYFLSLPVEFSMDEVRKRDMDDFSRMIRYNSVFRDRVREQMSSCAAREETAECLTRIARGLNMCFTGMQYLQRT